ncbi:MAG: PQQ-dependent sugar dehydrogenase [Tepidisphaeraceae bacterium]
MNIEPAFLSSILAAFALPRPLCALLLLSLFASVAAAQTQGPTRGARGEGVPNFTVRAGYRVDLVADQLTEARFLEFGDKGLLYLSQPRAGVILSLTDTDGDGTYDKTAKFVKEVPSAHCMDFHDGWLYFTQAIDGSCSKARDTNGDGVADEIVEVLPPKTVPSGGGHPFRGILLTSDSMYITVADPSNLTEDVNAETKRIYRFPHSSSEKSVFASGIRNTEKLRLRPGTDEIWGCDQGSNNFGKKWGDEKGNQPITDLNPPEELNHYVLGGFYGHPYITGNRVPRPEFSDRPDVRDLAAKTIPPAWAFPAHGEPDGFTFLEKDYFKDHQGDLFVAFHGSSNLVDRVGYRVERVLFDEMTGKPYGSLTVVNCLSPDGNTVLARPVDCAEAPDGSVLFSCDQTKKIYRISKPG